MGKHRMPPKNELEKRDVFPAEPDVSESLSLDDIMREFAAESVQPALQETPAPVVPAEEPAPESAEAPAEEPAPEPSKPKTVQKPPRAKKEKEVKKPAVERDLHKVLSAAKTPKQHGEKKYKISLKTECLTAQDGENAFADALFLFAGSAMLIAGKALHLEGTTYLVLCLAALAVAGWKTVYRGVRAVLSGALIAAPLLVSLGTVLVFAAGSYSRAVWAMILYGAVRLIAALSLKICRDAALSLSSVDSGTVRLITPEGLREADTDTVEPGDTVRVAAGELVAVDGTVLSGTGRADVSSLSGIPESVELVPGEKVLSGYRVTDGEVDITAEKPSGLSTAVKLLLCTEKAVESRSARQEQAAGKAGMITAAAAGLAILASAVSLLMGGDWARWFSRSGTMLYAASFECIVSVMHLPYIGAIISAYRKGIVIKNADAADKYAASGRVVFSKRGVVCDGEYTVGMVYSEKVAEQQLIDIAAAAEKHSSHPIARALRAAARTETEETVRPVEELAGRGIAAFVGGDLVLAGNARFLGDHGVECLPPKSFGTAIHVAKNGDYLGYIIVSDSVGEDTFDSVELIRSLGGNELIMLTGDVGSNARKVASRMNFSMVKADLTPEEKASALSYLLGTKNAGTGVTYISRGSDDEKLLFMADVGVALDAMHDEDAFDVADIAVMRRSVSGAAEARRICTLASRSAGVNVLAALTVKAVLELAALFAGLNILTAAVAELAVAIGVTVNSLRSYQAGKTKIRRKRHEKHR